MKRNPYFVLREIAGVPYLLPYGQSIASHDRGVKLNETGVLIWNFLEKARTVPELISLCAEYFEATAEERESLTADLLPFLSDLISHGAILDSRSPFFYDAPFSKALKIAGLTLRLGGSPEIFSSLFDPFSIPMQSNYDLDISACLGPCPIQSTGKVIIRNVYMSVMDCGDYYELTFPVNQQVTDCLLKKDATRALIYYRPPYGDVLKEEIFHCIREAFLYLAGKRDMVALHSTSILYQGKAFLFSGHSGMGKSTHARLWEECFDTPVLNGDLNLLAFEDGKPVIHGIPWCGTSGIFDVSTHPLGGITLLGRASSNYVTELSKDQQILLVDQRLISHSWTQEMFDSHLEVIKKIAPEILICKLFCTKDPEAALVMQKRIDQFLAKT